MGAQVWARVNAARKKSFLPLISLTRYICTAFAPISILTAQENKENRRPYDEGEKNLALNFEV